jgi:hypothetical protein
MMLVKQTPWLTPPRATVVRQAGNYRILPGTQIRRIAGTSNSAVEDELAHARMACREFQSTRERDAVYQYLTAVFEVVGLWKKQRRAKASSHQALAATKHPGAIRIQEPFAIVIFCTSDPRTVDARTRNKWARALRYAEEFKPNAQGLAEFIKGQGGINACADEQYKKKAKS